MLGCVCAINQRIHIVICKGADSRGYRAQLGQNGAKLFIKHNSCFFERYFLIFSRVHISSGIEKLSYFASAILNFFVDIFFLCSIPIKISQIFLGSKDGSKF